MMRVWILQHWDALRTNYWFLPALMAAAAVVLALVMPACDRMVQNHPALAWNWAYSGGPEGARAVLSTIAGSMITVAGTVFSITIVALTLASGQFGSRLLRNFIRDRSNQFVLGAFTATFIYCLLVLRTIRGSDHHPFVPGISVTLGILLALADLGVLIYFIHHVAVSIQATQIITVVHQELCETIDRLCPEQQGQHSADSVGGEMPSVSLPDAEECVPVVSAGSGYVDAINEEGMMALAEERDLIVMLARRPGHFIVKGSVLAAVYPVSNVDDKVADRVNRMFTLSPHRTPFQDVEFAVEQLVEIAVRALSPGINDPFTAIACIDRLGEALCRLVTRPLPSPYRCDEAGRVRVVTHVADFDGVLDAAFHQIRQYGRSSVVVLIRLLEMLAVIAEHADRQPARSSLSRHAVLVQHAAWGGIPEEDDRKDVEQRVMAVQAALHTSDARRRSERTGRLDER